MDSKTLLHEIQAARIYGTAYLAIYEKPLHTEWEQSVFEYFPMAGTSVMAFKECLTKISSKKFAHDILTRVLHKDLAYDAEMISLEEAKLLADKFFSLFSAQAGYFTNSTWNENEYSKVDNGFELGLRSWAPLTEATFDSGIIICDDDKIGIAWFADED